MRIDAAPQDCRLARSFLEAVDVANCGHVALALVNFGLFEDVLAEELLDWSFDAMTSEISLNENSMRKLLYRSSSDLRCG